ncbi:hypothetical protein F4779DRAFT_616097 [Xylariaceae sp. FL0662B]|nr:hypothetical protein F4779DRAFT_616097 [Xylariaceae sp. FL0662B]
MTLPFPHPSTLPPGFTLSRCTPADTPGIASVCRTRTQTATDAFAGADTSYWWVPSTEAMRRWSEARSATFFRDPRTQQFKVVDDNNAAVGSRRVVAYAKWVLPRRAMRGLLRQGFVAYDEDGRAVEQALPENERDEDADVETPVFHPPEGADPELYYGFFNGLRQMGEKWNTKEKLVLSIICADKAYHGRGIGSALIKPVLDVADAEGITAYLEAVPLAAPLYKRHGFVTVDKLEYDLSKTGREGKAVLEIMVREPQRTSSE